MHFRGPLLLASLCIAAGHPFARPEDDPAKVAQLNQLLDKVLSEVRKGPVLLENDPLHFPDQFRAVEHGTYRMTDARATGLATLYRMGDASYILADGQKDEMIVTATLATDAVSVKAYLQARTNAEDISHGKVQGALEPVQVVLQMRMLRGQHPTVSSFNVNSHLHPIAEKYDGKTDDRELMSIVKDALDYGFNFVYGVTMEKVIEGSLRQDVERALAAVDYSSYV